MSKPKQLVWSEPSAPTGYCFYDHCVADTPVGPIRIEWKSWKKYDSYCVSCEFLEYPTKHTCSSLEEAKAEAQKAWDKLILDCLE